jgi:hypothetical protein
MLKKVLLIAAAFTGFVSLAHADTWFDSLCPQTATLAPAMASNASDRSSPPSESDSRTWSMTLSPYTHHWDYSVDHRPVILGSLDYYGTPTRFCGAALFKNSFGQPSTYVYFGKEWPQFLGSEQWFAKVSGGLIYGYKGQFKDKIPFDDYGIAPAIIPSVGYRLNQKESLQLILLGNSALMFAYGRDF